MKRSRPHMTPSFKTAPTGLAILAMLAILATLSLARPLTAQETSIGVPDPAARYRLAEDASAVEISREFRRVLDQYPSTLRSLLQLDPVLMTDPGFMESYPQLAEFIAAYPEVPHNPTYFLGSPRSPNGFDGEDLAIMFVMVSIVGAVIWLIKTLIDYRRWSRLSQVQADAHAKLLDRFTASQDLLAYLETAPGRRFLESAPIQLDGTSMPGSPINRILLSSQAGLVLAAGGIGLLLALSRLEDQEAANALFVVAVLAISLGIGFVISAGMAFLLSHRMGVIDRPERERV